MTGALRIAVAGKGGAGKTTFSATLARLMAGRGKRVVVIDGDSNPNVAVALGIGREPADQIGERGGPLWRCPLRRPFAGATLTAAWAPFTRPASSSARRECS